jgi:hypothetical protein
MGAADAGTQDRTVEAMTAYFILIALAASLMTQLSGAALGQHSLLRHGLQNSSIFCSFGIIVFVGDIIHGWAGRRETLRGAVTTALQTRLKYLTDEEPEQTSRGTSAIRRIFFSCWYLWLDRRTLEGEGHPLDEAWGFMFFITFLILKLPLLSVIPREILLDVDRQGE